MQYRVVKMEHNFEGTSPIKTNGNLFINKKQKSTLAGTEPVAGPNAPPISQYNNKEAVSSTNVPTLKSSDIEETSATTGMTGQKLI